MRQHHVAGDKVFVDYSGKKISIVDPKTGEVRDAEIFIAVLGASSYTYAEATWTQTLPDWIGAHVRHRERESGKRICKSIGSGRAAANGGGPGWQIAAGQIRYAELDHLITPFGRSHRRLSRRSSAIATRDDPGSHTPAAS